MFGPPSTPFGGFGAPSQQNTAPAFGASSAPTGGLFGSSAAGTAPTFGAPQSTGFGGTTSTFGSTAAPSGGLFGGGGGFGSSGFGAPAPAPFGAPPATGGGLFGSTPTPGGFGTSSAFGTSTPSTGVGLFGSTTQPTSSIFGQPQQPPAFGSTGGFGSSATAPSAFGAPATGGLFGAPAPTSFGGSTANAFGAAPAPTGGLFGSPGPTTGAFGSSTSTFGAPTPAFGAPSAPSVFGAPPAAPFGTPAPAPSQVGLFGSPPASTIGSSTGGGTRAVPYAVTTRAEGTGSIQMQDITAMPQYENKSVEELRFEDYSQGNRGTAAPGGGLFGSPAPAVGFGSGGFGAPAPAPFGGTSNLSTPATGFFGSTASAPSTLSFGNTTAQAPTGGLFGSTATTTFGSTTAPSSAFGSSPAPAPFSFATPAAPSTSLFGSTTNTGFGAAPSGSLFGSPAPAPFGAPAPSGSLFGSLGSPAPAPFGAPAPTGGLFGQPSPAPSAFGGFGTSTFGMPAPAPAPVGFGGFGAPAPSPFGQPPAGGFGSTLTPQPPPGQPTYSFSQPQQQQQTPTSLFPPNVQIMPPGFSEVLDQQLRALDHQRAELEKTEVWRGSPAKTSVTTPTSVSNPFDFSTYSTQSHLITHNPRTSTTRIQPRGVYPKSTVSKSSSNAVASQRDITQTIMSPEQFMRSSKLRLVPNPEAVQPPSRLLRLNLEKSDKSDLLSPSILSTSESVDPPPCDEKTVDDEITVDQLNTPRASTPASLQTPKMIASPGYNYYQKVIASADESPNTNGATTAFSPNSKKPLSVVPVLTKHGYKVSPSIEELSAMNEVDLAAIVRFCVARPGYGKIEWDGAVDVRNANLDRIVSIESCDISVYTLDEEEGTKPPVGCKLNRPAVLTYYEVFPQDGGSQASPEEREKFYNQVKRSTTAMGAEFISYDPSTGVWKIRVQHFSRYSLCLVEEESDNDIDMKEKVQEYVNTNALVSTNTVETQDSVAGLHYSDYDDSEGANMVSDIDMTESEIQRKITMDAERAYEQIFSITKQVEKSAEGDMYPNIIEDFTYEDEVDSCKFESDNIASKRSSVVTNELVIPAFSISQTCKARIGVAQLEVCFSSRIGRSFRIGWMPDGSFLKLCAESGPSPVLVRAHPVMSDKRLVEPTLKLLKTFKENSQQITTDSKCPIYSIPRLWADSSAEDKIAQALKSFSLLFDVNSEPCCTFELLSFFLNQTQSSSNQRGSIMDFSSGHRRLTDIKQLLARLCSADIRNEIDLQLSRRNILGAIYVALSGGDISTACDIACEGSLIHLASALSTSFTGRDDIKQFIVNVTTTKEKRDASVEAINVLKGVVGNCSGQLMSIEKTVLNDWRRNLLLRLLQERNGSLEDLIVQFEADMMSGAIPMKTHNIQSVFYQLLLLGSRHNSMSLVHALHPLGYCSQEYDFSLSFHLAHAIGSTRILTDHKSFLSTELMEHLGDGYIAQLVQTLNWEWAVFVSLCTTSDLTSEQITLKRARAKEIILRHYDDDDPRSSTRREFLEKHVGAPSLWFEEALMYRCAYKGDAIDYVKHALALSEEKGLYEFQENILPNLFFMHKAEIDSVLELLQPTSPSRDSTFISLLPVMQAYFELQSAISELSDGLHESITSEQLKCLWRSYNYVENSLVAFDKDDMPVQTFDRSGSLPIFPTKVSVKNMVSAARHNLCYFKAQIDVLSVQLSM